MSYDETIRFENRVLTVDELERHLYITNQKSDLVDAIHQLSVELDDACQEIQNLEDYDTRDYNALMDDVENELGSLKRTMQHLITRVENNKLSQEEILGELKDFANALTDTQHTLCTY